MAEYAVEETGHTDAATDVRANANDCTSTPQYAALAPWKRR